MRCHQSSSSGVHVDPSRPLRARIDTWRHVRPQMRRPTAWCCGLLSLSACAGGDLTCEEREARLRTDLTDARARVRELVLLAATAPVRAHARRARAPPADTKACAAQAARSSARSIPVLGIGTIFHAGYLLRCVRSIDYPARRRHAHRVTDEAPPNGASHPRALGRHASHRAQRHRPLCRRRGRHTSRRAPAHPPHRGSE